MITITRRHVVESKRAVRAPYPDGRWEVTLDCGHTVLRRERPFVNSRVRCWRCERGEA